MWKSARLCLTSFFLSNFTSVKDVKLVSPLHPPVPATRRLHHHAMVELAWRTGRVWGIGGDRDGKVNKDLMEFR